MKKEDLYRKHTRSALQKTKAAPQKKDGFLSFSLNRSRLRTLMNSRIHVED